jgi:hypothetical protein
MHIKSNGKVYTLYLFSGAAEKSTAGTKKLVNSAGVIVRCSRICRRSA